MLAAAAEQQPAGVAAPQAGWEQLNESQRRLWELWEQQHGPGSWEQHRLAWEQQQAADLTRQQRSDPGWHGKLDGYAPVQGDGTVDGHAWYFRARWAGWSFEIAEPAEVDWTAVDIGQEVGGWRTQDEAWGEDEFAASYMPYATAWAIIQQCIARFRDGLLPYTPARPARP